MEYNILKVNALPDIADMTVNTIYMVNTGDEKFELYVTGKTLPIVIKGLKGINGSVFITNIEPNGSGNVGEKVFSSDGVVLDSCLTDTANVIVSVLALPGHTNYKPVVTINESVVTLVGGIDRPLFTGTINITLSGEGTLKVIHEDGAEHQTTINSEVAPVIVQSNFVNGYPGIQTELKANDTFDLYVESDVAIIAIELSNYGAFNASTFSVSSNTTHIITGTIANRSTSVQSLGAKVRVQKSTGSWSDWYLTESDGSVDGTNLIKLNNIYPVITMGTINYPVSQEALKNVEQSTVNHTIVNFDNVSYDSPNSQLTISNNGTYEPAKTTTRLAGDYNISTNNFRATANRIANDATTSSQTIVKIANVAATLTVTKPSRLRSGGNDGTPVQNHTITITANQNLIESPTLVAPVGTWQGAGFSGATVSWTRSLQITDDMTKQSYSWSSILGTNLAGIQTTAFTGDSTYVLGGFVTRQITLLAFFNETSMNVAARDYTKVTFSWNYNTNINVKASLGTDVPPAVPNNWCLESIDTNPTVIRILDTEQTNASSAASIITIEETI